MKTKLALVVGTVFTALTLAGCNKTPGYTTTPLETPEIEVTQPPVSSSTDLDEMDKEIDGTTLYQEDFSDL